MATESITGQEPGGGWQRGFSNLFHKEFSAWWGTRRWWVQGALWAGGLNGLLAMALFVLPPMMEAQGEPPSDPLVMGGQMFFALGMMAVSIGVVILLQGAVLDEKTSGTAAWILSKPVTRSAFILSKLLANAASVLALMVLLPSLIAFFQFALAVDSLDPLRFLAGVGLMVLHVLFYLTLTLLAGVLSDNRGIVLGTTLGFLLVGGTLLRSAWPLSLISPWVLPDIAGAVLAGNPLPTSMLLPVLATALWTAVFVWLCVWRFDKQEL